MADPYIPDEEELEAEPESEQPQGSSRLIQWLVVIGLAVMFVPLYLVSATVKADNEPLTTQVANIDATLAGTLGPNAVEKSLNSTLVKLQQQSNGLDSARPTISANRVDWPSMMAIIGGYDQTHVVLISVVQNGKTITVSGQADDENAVMGYAQSLKDSNQFVRVIVQGIDIKPSPTATATSTPTPTPSQTPSPIPGTKISATAKATTTPLPTTVSPDRKSTRLN